MMTSDFVDPYVDLETGILRNLVGATTYDELSRAEGEFAAFREILYKIFLVIGRATYMQV